jgi:hypothetical protein
MRIWDRRYSDPKLCERRAGTPVAWSAVAAVLGILVSPDWCFLRMTLL